MLLSQIILQIGNLRTTFFYNQVGYKYQVKSSKNSDFKVEEKI